jgi:hypothetical protein
MDQVSIFVCLTSSANSPNPSKLIYNSKDVNMYNTMVNRWCVTTTSTTSTTGTMKSRKNI